MYRCINSKCRHVFCYPQPDDAALTEFYNTDYYCTDSRLYGQTPPEVLKQILDWFPSVKGPFLDVGCGEGHFFNALPPNARKYYTGVEADDTARKTAREKTGRKIVATIEELVKTDQSYQMIILNQVIEHLRDPIETLRQVRQISLPQATLFIATANIDCLKSKIQKENWDQFRNRTHLHLFSRQSLSMALYKGGWTKIKLISSPINYPHHGKIKKKFHQALRGLKLDGNLTMAAGGPCRG